MRKLAQVGILAVMAGALSACSGRTVVAVRAPAPPRPVAVGVVGVAPGPGYAWVDGYYDWRGARYVWMPGAWVKPPRPHAVWTPGYWRPHGHSHVWVAGHWRF
ncbi:MAG: YXWGXW repeat-containing protein [Acidobacteria bacterium]|nr:YXWGXW repeat-containing protein [Acidobacteriota bacterium]